MIQRCFSHIKRECYRLPVCPAGLCRPPCPHFRHSAPYKVTLNGTQFAQCSCQQIAASGNFAYVVLLQ